MKIKNNPTLEQAIEEYLHYCQGESFYSDVGTLEKPRPLKTLSTRGYKKILMLFKEFCPSNLKVSSISSHHYVSFRNAMIKGELTRKPWKAESSKKLIRVVMHRFFEVQISLGRMKYNPVRGIIKERVQATRKVHVYLEEEEFKALLSVIESDSDYIMISLGGAYGLRPAEIVGNESEGGDIRGFTISDALSLIKTRILPVQGKGGKYREVSTIEGLHPDWDEFFLRLDREIRRFYTSLKRKIRNNPDKYRVRDLRRLKFLSKQKPEFNAVLKEYCRKAMIKVITPHKLRHTFGMAGIKIMRTVMLKRLMGHASIAQTMAYAEMLPIEVRMQLMKQNLLYVPQKNKEENNI